MKLITCKREASCRYEVSLKALKNHKRNLKLLCNKQIDLGLLFWHRYIVSVKEFMQYREGTGESLCVTIVSAYIIT